MKKLLITLFCLAVGQPVFAQQETPAPGPEVTLHIGLLSRGTGRAVEKQMKKDGFGEEPFGVGFFGESESPERSEFSVQAGLLFPVKSKYKVKGIVQYRGADVRGSANFLDYLDMETSVVSAAALGVLPIPSKLLAFRVGAGPAYHVANAKVTYGGAEQADKSISKLGFVLEGGFSSPVNARFFVDMQVQYIYAGKGNFGSYTFTGTDLEDKPLSRTADFSKTSLNQFSVSLGAGYRFGKVKS